MSQTPRSVTGDFVIIDNEKYTRINHYDQMPPFFISVVSHSDHWLFISSTGGLTAGRRNADLALFPYETDDKIAAGFEHTGSKTIIRTAGENTFHIWEPFSKHKSEDCRVERTLYKNVIGNKIIFDELDHNRQLRFRISWRVSERFGFIRTCMLENLGSETCRIQLLDGMVNILPFGATSALQSAFSNLLNAYKRSELEPDSGLGIYSLSATLTDRAEPSESLKATAVWQTGMDVRAHLLSPEQIERFTETGIVTNETDVCGQPGAYLIQSEFALEAQQKQNWLMAADVGLDGTDAANLIRYLHNSGETAAEAVESDITLGSDQLLTLVGTADGLQKTADEVMDTHHFANTLFNIMRGGIFADGYRIQKTDVANFIFTRNRSLFPDSKLLLSPLPESMVIQDLWTAAGESGSLQLHRLCSEYLPLTFSRRHGDPSRPWNQFSINVKEDDGSPRLDYQGNWRDIFQNWEPLAVSFPDFTGSMIARFLNATTADGYNPYRITRDGIDWEVPEPENPWANIGYWSDHQIIYLLKLMELAAKFSPNEFSSLWELQIFSYANIPYRLKPYSEMLNNWYDTIDFDWDEQRRVEERVAETGSDGRMVYNSAGSVLQVCLCEKLLVLLLAKLTNLIPEGGIWMNTQRPEWNDANNALVGKGISVVTAAYLRRFIVFFRDQSAQADSGSFKVNERLAQLLETVFGVLKDHTPFLDSGFSNSGRRMVMDALGAAATEYRSSLYREGVCEIQTNLNKNRLTDFLDLALQYIDQTLNANFRSDGLVHSYNILALSEKEAEVRNLYPMLEGQVAILSSGLLKPEQALAVLKALRTSDLYREDQHSYILYPNRKLPGFLMKNTILQQDAEQIALISCLMKNRDVRLMSEDVNGRYHFNGSFRNAEDVSAVLDKMERESEYSDLVKIGRTPILNLFEKTFDHQSFTGRSGTFFAYEGLGSIYWHMVSKLLLAVQECALAVKDQIDDDSLSEELRAVYFEIRNGLGFNKTPAEYGAFPTDPYSHTPANSGAKQPGMTGQVKEEILSRFGELGVEAADGVLGFTPQLLQPEEFCRKETCFVYRAVDGSKDEIKLAPGSLAFTICGIPVVYAADGSNQTEILFTDGKKEMVSGQHLPHQLSRSIFSRENRIKSIMVGLDYEISL